MIGTSIVAQIGRLQTWLARFLCPARGVPPDLHTAWLHLERLPVVVRRSPLVRRQLDLLGPLAWDRLPERDLERNWEQPTLPYAAFIPALLVKLNEGHKWMGSMRRFLAEHPVLTWVLGFRLPISNLSDPGFDASPYLPTTRNLSHLLRVLPNGVLQFLLDDSVRLIRETLSAEGVKTGECISLDTKHIVAWVQENNPKAYVDNRYDKTR